LIADAEPRAFAAGLVKLLSDPELRRRLSRAGREFAARYDWSEVTPRLLDMYRMAIGREGQGRRPFTSARRLRLGRSAAGVRWKNRSALRM
jgi:hypothetical protein